MSAPGFAHEHQVLLRAILEADRKTFDKEVNNRSEGLHNNYSAFLRLCSNLELHDYVSALVEAIVDDLKHKRLSGLQTSHAVHAGSEIGHLEPFQTWLNVSEPKELRNQSSIVGMNIEVCKIPLREALDLRLGNGQAIGEESLPEYYIESVRALFKDLPGNRIEWNRNLSAWVPMRQ